MAIRYRLYQSQREGATKVKWYARAVALNTIGTDALADRIQSNYTVKKSDCKAVLQELSEVIRENPLHRNLYHCFNCIQADTPFDIQQQKQPMREQLYTKQQKVPIAMILFRS